LLLGQAVHAAGISSKPCAPPVSGTEPRSARVGAMLGRPVKAAGAGFFLFYGFFILLLKILNIFKIRTFFFYIF
jgi:hypothetical protein